MKTNLLAILITIFSVLSLTCYAADSYRVTSTTTSINEFSTCRGISNYHPNNDLFIPTKTSTEWTSAQNSTASQRGLFDVSLCSVGGRAYCWGDSDYGKLGSGFYQAGIALSPVRAISSTAISFTQVDVAGTHSCGVDNLGKVYCWGSNIIGEVGQDESVIEYALYPTQVNSSTSQYFTQVATGFLHSCGVTNLNRAYCWGDGAYGQLGDDDESNSYEPVRVTSNTAISFTQISAGSYHTCGVDLNNRAYCWGFGSSGALGNGSTNDALTPVRVTSNTAISFTQVSAGSGHTCGVDLNNRAYCWGLGTAGGLGNGSTTTQLYPIRVTSNTSISFTRVSAGTNFTCALDINSRAYCWGNGGSGQIGDGGSTQRLNPVRVVTGTTISYTSISAGDNHACATDTISRTYCWGAGGNSQLGNGGIISNQPNPYRVTSNTVISLSSVEAGTFHSCGLDSLTGRAYCWGEGGDGQNGDGGGGPQPYPSSPISNTSISFTLVDTGNSHACGIDANSRAYCWGNASNGQLGIGTTSTFFYPHPVRVTTATTISFTGISVGNQHGCAIDTNNRAYCWGYGGDSALGYGGTSAQNVPVRVISASLSISFSQISAGSSHSCGIDLSNRAYCWGEGTYGALGYGGTSAQSRPIRVISSTNISYTQITAGRRFTCAIDINRNLYCWGSESNGVLGNGNTLSNQNYPIKVISPTNVSYTQVNAGEYNACAVDTNNRGYCWGEGSAIGDGIGDEQPYPTRVISSTNISFTQITTGAYQSCGIDKVSRTYCWGYNRYGQGGNGTLTDSDYPVRVLSGTAILMNSISAGAYFTCGTAP